jgi:hypothetical protein
MENIYQKPDNEMSEIEKLTKQIAELLEQKKISFVFNGEPWYYRGNNDELTLTEILGVLPEGFGKPQESYMFELLVRGSLFSRMYCARYTNINGDHLVSIIDKNATIACAKTLIEVLTNYEESFR